VPAQPFDLPLLPRAENAVDVALKGSRMAYWPEVSKEVDTPVYDQTKLQHGHLIQGPALIESEYTTVVIPPGMKYSVNQYALGIMENDEQRVPTAAGSAAIRG
jgi:N-methylhydantoinase A/acetophenone carboxylase